MVRLTELKPATQGLGIPCSIRTELQVHSVFPEVESSQLFKQPYP